MNDEKPFIAGQLPDGSYEKVPNPEYNKEIPITPVTGYRKLTAEEISLMNEGKALGETIAAYIKKLEAMPVVGYGMEMQSNMIDGRWLALGRTDMQKGLMFLLRAIARPTTF